MTNRITKTISFSPEAVALLDKLQTRFKLGSHDEVVQTAIKILAVADKHLLYVFKDGVLTELEVSDER